MDLHSAQHIDHAEEFRLLEQKEAIIDRKLELRKLMSLHVDLTESDNTPRKEESGPHTAPEEPAGMRHGLYPNLLGGLPVSTVGPMTPAPTVSATPRVMRETLPFGARPAVQHTIEPEEVQAANALLHRVDNPPLPHAATQNGVPSRHLNFPTLVRKPAGNGYIELRCYICGGNCKRQLEREFLKGLPGMQAHITNAHRSQVTEGKISKGEVLQRCQFREYSLQDIDDMMSKLQSAPVIEEVMVEVEKSAEPRKRAPRRRTTPEKNKGACGRTGSTTRKVVKPKPKLKPRAKLPMAQPQAAADAAIRFEVDPDGEYDEEPVRSGRAVATSGRELRSTAAIEE